MKCPRHLQIFLNDYLKPRIERGEFTVILVVGESNTGKTWSSVAIAEYIEKKINNASFTPEQFILSFNDYSKLFEKWYSKIVDLDNCVKHKAIIWDEAARSFHAKRSMSKEAKKILDILQTARVYQHIYFFLYQKEVDVPPDIWRNAHFVIRTYFHGKQRKMSYHVPFYDEEMKPARQKTPLSAGSLGTRLGGILPTPTLSLIRKIEEKVMAYKMRVNIGIDVLPYAFDDVFKAKLFLSLNHAGLFDNPIRDEYVWSDYLPSFKLFFGIQGSKIWEWWVGLSPELMIQIRDMLKDWAKNKEPAWIYNTAKTKKLNQL